MVFRGALNLIDWACGQGIGTMSYLNFKKDKKYNDNINNICLIEPSLVALRRASLHVKKCSNKIVTINKDIDSLSDNDFDNFKFSTYFHVFSNIIDIDFFSIDSLLKLISKSFKGTNYFIIASPYIDITRTSRINSFVDSFRGNKEFVEFISIDNKKGYWSGTNWSRVIRVFKTDI